MVQWADQGGMDGQDRKEILVTQEPLAILWG